MYVKIVLSDLQVNWINLKTRKEVLASSMPDCFLHCYLGIITDEDKSYSLYVIGVSNNSYVMNSVLTWNSKIHIWRSLATTINERLYFGLAVFNKKLYVVGGVDKNDKCLNSMEMYDPITNKWSECSSMVTKRRNLGVSRIY